MWPRAVADFYSEFMSALRSLKIDVTIWKMPVEVADPIAFDQDRVHAAYDKEYARRFWRALVSIDDVFEVFRSRFIGKSSPAHFFWGSFDLAVTRFSGRPAPPGFAGQKVRPEAAFYHQQLGEFLLMHEDVRRAASPTIALLDFLQSTYEAGATAANWDRKALERPPQPAAGAA